MRVALLVVAVGLLGGCASSRTTGSLTPGRLPAPTTLRDVNAVLLDTQATVYFSDDRTPFQALIQITPETTTLNAWNGFGYDAPREIATHEISRVEVDDSQSARQGAWKGFKYGTLPGATAMGVGLAISVVDESPKGCFLICLSAGEVLFAYGVLATGVGAVIGPPAGALSTARSYPVAVYWAPVSRYPDAAPAQTARPDSAIFLSRAAG